MQDAGPRPMPMGTEADAAEAGHDLAVAVLPLAHVPRAIVNRDTRGFRYSPGGVAVLGAVLLAVCCGLPVLIGAGVAAGGLALGSAVIVAAGLGVWGWRRQRKRRCGPRRS